MVTLKFIILLLKNASTTKLIPTRYDIQKCCASKTWHFSESEEDDQTEESTGSSGEEDDEYESDNLSA